MQQGQYTEEQLHVMSTEELRQAVRHLSAELATLQDAALSSKTFMSTPDPVFPPFSPLFPPQLSPTSYSTATHPSPSSPPPTTTTLTSAPALALRVKGLPSSDYQNAKLAFEVVLEQFGTTPGKAATLPPNSDWHVQICAENGHRQLDPCILDSADTRVPVSADGVARVTELQFLKLSSKNGNHFRLNFSLVGTGAPAVSTKSEKITIKCARMRCDAKISHADLQPEDPISKMPDIGKGYAAKFEKLAFVTVADLAKIDLKLGARLSRLELLKKIRNTRGSLTIEKLESHIRVAKAAVRRVSGIAEPEPQPQPECAVAAEHLSEYAALASLSEPAADAADAAVLPAGQPSAPSAVMMTVVAEDLTGKGMFTTPMDTCGSPPLCGGALLTTSHNHSSSSSSHSHSHSSNSSSNNNNNNHNGGGMFDTTLFDMDKMINTDMINHDYFEELDATYPPAPWTLTGDGASKTAPTGSHHLLLD